LRSGTGSNESAPAMPTADAIDFSIRSGKSDLSSKGERETNIAFLFC